MAANLNTFAVVLLAFPFYLAQKGRLVAYVDLAKPGAAPASGAGSTMPTNSTASTSPAPKDSGGVSLSNLSDLAGLATTFTDAAGLFV